jgi:hypothetical protein
MKRAAVAVAILCAFAPSNVAAAVHLNGFATTYDASTARAPSVEDQIPAPGSHLRTFYPQFSVKMNSRSGAAVRRSSVRFFVDGMDVTANASVRENTVTYIPKARMAPGWHDVFMEGADTAGQTFSDAWVFQSLAPDVAVDPPVNSGFAFFPSGDPNFQHGFMHFFLIAPGDGFATLQLCGFPSYAFAHVAFSPAFFLTIAIPYAVTFYSPLVGCNAGAFFSPYNQFNTVFVPVPWGIAGPNVTANVPTFPKTRAMQPVYRRVDVPPGMDVTPAVGPAPQTYVPRYAQPVFRVPIPGMLPAPGIAPAARAAPGVVYPYAAPRSVLPVTRAPLPPVPHVMPNVPATVPIPHPNQ